MVFQTSSARHRSTRWVAHSGPKRRSRTQTLMWQNQRREDVRVDDLTCHTNDIERALVQKRYDVDLDRTSAIASPGEEDISQLYPIRAVRNLDIAQ